MRTLGHANPKKHAHTRKDWAAPTLKSLPIHAKAGQAYPHTQRLGRADPKKHAHTRKGWAAQTLKNMPTPAKAGPRKP